MEKKWKKLIATQQQPSVTQQDEPKQIDDKSMPLLDEVLFFGEAVEKNQGGSKSWTCKHCHKYFKSSYTRIHYHFFCAPAGVSADIRRCNAILKDRAEFDFPLFKREKLVPKCTIEESFKIIDRDMVNMTILRCLCANGLSVNLLRSPYFHEMVTTINKGSKSYKSPSYEKTRMSLLDECRNNLEKELFLVPINLVQTWSFDCL